MKKIILTSITVIACLSLALIGVFNWVTPSQLQIATLKVLFLICGGAALYCFVVGEIARNNSQMDKLWSILPIAYVWVIAIMGGMKARSLIVAFLVTLWGVRLTFNFARKGAYSIRFWEGEEDYRWPLLRANKPFSNKFIWALFDLFFISIYQNLLVLFICLPAVAIMESTLPLGIFDFLAGGFAVFFLLIEMIADEEQWAFQSAKHRLLKEGKSLAELPKPYNLGFNTIGLWGHMRHPNYLGEQGFWAALYCFVIGAGVTSFAIFHWTIIGPALLILLFLGSSTFGESISSRKYPLYKEYCRAVPKYIFWKKYVVQGDDKE
ncbi:MAG: DUF1295 domain-containing protein [Bacilli bacterium]|nr:DUF1295 domain-containing protein [Bacilli bacterium]